MDNEYASQFEFRAAESGPYVRMFDTRVPGDDAVWTGHYALSGRPMLDDSVPPGVEIGQADPHMVLIAVALNEAVKPLNEALRRV